MKVRGEKGFSLIEVLIVVAIIAILATIAMPAMSSYRAKAFNAAARSDVVNFKLMMEAYYAEHKAYPTL